MDSHIETPDFVKPSYRKVVDVIAAALCIGGALPIGAMVGWPLRAVMTFVVCGALAGIFRRPNGGSFEKDTLVAAAYVGLTWLALVLLFVPALVLMIG